MEPLVKIRFAIYGDNFDPQMITQYLQVIPSEVYRKSELSTLYNVPRKETCWSFCIEYEQSYDINIQFKKMYDIFHDKVDALNEVARLYDLEMNISVAVKLKNSYPAITVEKYFVDFLSKIEKFKFLDIDLGNNPHS